MPGVVSIVHERVTGITPLQAGQWHSDPDAATPLFDLLFGDPGLAMPAWQDSPARTDPGAHVFALLDSAKVVNLPELLETSGLEHTCLFDGEAFEEIATVGPWLVRLDPQAGFCRNLLTRGPAGWHLWDRRPGLFLRTGQSLSDLRHTLRKLLRVRDHAHRWYYFRFWEGGSLLSLLRGLNPEAASKVLGPDVLVIGWPGPAVAGDVMDVYATCSPRTVQTIDGDT